MTGLTLAIICFTKRLRISFINQTFLINTNNKIIKFLLFSSLLSLGELLPFAGFLPKWTGIQSIISNSSILIISIMVFLSLISLYYHLRISYSAFIILGYENRWNYDLNSSKYSLSKTIILSIFSMLGLILCSILINFIS